MNLLINKLARSIKFLMLLDSRLLNDIRAGPIRVVEKTFHIKASK